MTIEGSFLNIFKKKPESGKTGDEKVSDLGGVTLEKAVDMDANVEIGDNLSAEMKQVLMEGEAAVQEGQQLIANSDPEKIAQNPQLQAEIIQKKRRVGRLLKIFGGVGVGVAVGYGIATGDKSFGTYNPAELYALAFVFTAAATLFGAVKEAMAKNDIETLLRKLKS